MANKKVTVLVSPWSPSPMENGSRRKENEAKVYGGDSASKSDAAGRCRGGRLKKNTTKTGPIILFFICKPIKKQAFQLE